MLTSRACSNTNKHHLHCIRERKLTKRVRRLLRRPLHSFLMGHCTEETLKNSWRISKWVNYCGGIMLKLYNQTEYHHLTYVILSIVTSIQTRYEKHKQYRNFLFFLTLGFSIEQTFELYLIYHLLNSVTVFIF